MMEVSKQKWSTLRLFLENNLCMNESYRAGDIYQAYINEPNSESISRKDFEMFLRDQVIKKDGLLKRTAHGIYEIRLDPNDRGVFFPRKTKEDVESTEITLDEILDDCIDLASKIKIALNDLEKQPYISYSAQKELRSIKESLFRVMDIAITGVTSMMSWSEDNIGFDNQENSFDLNITF